jgi:hypothetical protein
MWRYPARMAALTASLTTPGSLFQVPSPTSGILAPGHTRRSSAYQLGVSLVVWDSCIEHQTAIDSLLLLMWYMPCGGPHGTWTDVQITRTGPATLHPNPDPWTHTRVEGGGGVCSCGLHHCKPYRFGLQPNKHSLPWPCNPRPSPVLRVAVG